MENQSKYAGGLRRMLLSEMPGEMRAKIEALLLDPGADDEALRKLYVQSARRLVLARPREQIAWNPAVDPEKCTGCETCFAYCPHGVYQMREGKAVVANPTECVILCSNCMPMCPAEAIDFPKQKDYASLLRYE